MLVSHHLMAMGPSPDTLLCTSIRNMASIKQLCSMLPPRAPVRAAAQARISNSHNIRVSNCTQAGCKLAVPLLLMVVLLGWL
jgi:hypothetical protein